MAINKGRAAFAQLAQQNRDTFMKNRGAKSPYRDITAPLGVYYARIMKNPLDVANVEQKGPDGKKNGFKKPTMRARLQVSIICSADPQCLPSDLEAHKGAAGFIQWYLPEGDDEAMQRYYDALDLIGVDTNGIVLTEDEIQDPNNQYTLEQVSDFIEEQKPFCMISIVQGGTAGSKFINYKSSVNQEDIEQLIGHAIDNSAHTVLEETDDGQVVVQTAEVYQEVPQAPFEGTSDVPAEPEVEIEWEQVGTLWHDKTNDKWYDETGAEVENPNKPKPQPPKPQPPKSVFGKPTTPATKPAAPVASKPTSPAFPKPGSRK